MEIRRDQMGLIFMLFCSTMATASSLQQIFPTESNYHQKTNTGKHGQDGFTNQIGRRYSASATTSSHGGGHGNAAHGGGGDAGGSSPHTGGAGMAVIPIYAAGSAQARRHQGQPRNAGNRHENNMALLIAAVLAAIAHLYRVF